MREIDGERREKYIPRGKRSRYYYREGLLFMLKRTGTRERERARSKDDERKKKRR